MADSDSAAADYNTSNIKTENIEDVFAGRYGDVDNNLGAQNLEHDQLSVPANQDSIEETINTEIAAGYMPVKNKPVFEMNNDHNSNIGNVTFANEFNPIQTPCENESTNIMGEDQHENDPATNTDENLHTCLHTKTFKIFVSNLPPGFLNCDLKDLFDPYGEVVECEIFAKNYAFVHMKTEESGIVALRDLNGLEIRGCKINVKKSNHCAVPKYQKSIGTALEVTTYKIFVGNLNESVTKDKLENLISPFGRIVEMEIYRNNNAFLHMETEEEGKKVIEQLNGKVLPEMDRPVLFTAAKNLEGPSTPTIRLLVKQVATSVTADALRSLFFPYGLVLKVTIFPEVDQKSNCRQAIVHLEQFGNIRSAIKDLTGKEIDGSKIMVEPCYGKEPPSSTIPKKTTPQPPPYSNKRTYQQWPPSHVNKGPITRIPRNMPPGSLLPPQPLFNSMHRPPPTKQMRLIPMPSEAELQQHRRFGGGIGGMNASTPLFQQQFSNNNYGGFNEPNSQYGYEDEGYDDYNGFQNEVGNSNPFDCPSQLTNFVNWSNPTNPNPFCQPNLQQYHPAGNASRNPQPNMFNNFPPRFPPSFPPASAFPQGPPRPLLSTPTPNKHNSPNSEDCDWSSDVPLSGFEEFSGAAEANSISTHAVPFDYNQMSAKRKPPPPPNVQRNPNAKYYYNQKGKLMFRGERGGKQNKKGKARRPGFGSTQQMKTFANQSGNEIQLESESPSQPGPSQGFFNQSSESIQSATTPTTPYFQKTWPSKNKQQKKSRPTTKQIKDAEEDQKKQYSDYLKAKSWLYHAIPGTVKRV